MTISSSDFQSLFSKPTTTPRLRNMGHGRLRLRFLLRLQLGWFPSWHRGLFGRPGAFRRLEHCSGLRCSCRSCWWCSCRSWGWGCCYPGWRLEGGRFHRLRVTPCRWSLNCCRRRWGRWGHRFHGRHRGLGVGRCRGAGGQEPQNLGRTRSKDQATYLGKRVEEDNSEENQRHPSGIQPASPVHQKPTIGNMIENTQNEEFSLAMVFTCLGDASKCGSFTCLRYASLAVFWGPCSGSWSTLHYSNLRLENPRFLIYCSYIL